MYEGRWKGRPVALKVCYCVEITPERIEQIVAEGAALGGIRHENVIEVRARWWLQGGWRGNRLVRPLLRCTASRSHRRQCAS